MTNQPVLKFVCTWKGVINLGFGGGLVVAPTAILAAYGLILDPTAEFIARLLGAACLGAGIIQFFGRNSRPSDLQTLVVGAVALTDLFGLIIAILATLAGLMNPLGWSVAALYAFATFGFGFAYLKECRGFDGAVGATSLKC